MPYRRIYLCTRGYVRACSRWDGQGLPKIGTRAGPGPGRGFVLIWIFEAAVLALLSLSPPCLVSSHPHTLSPQFSHPLSSPRIPPSRCAASASAQGRHLRGRDIRPATPGEKNLHTFVLMCLFTLYYICMYTKCRGKVRLPRFWLICIQRRSPIVYIPPSYSRIESA